VVVAGVSEVSRDSRSGLCEYIAPRSLGLVAHVLAVKGLGVSAFSIAWVRPPDSYERNRRPVSLSKARGGSIVVMADLDTLTLFLGSESTSPPS